MTPDFLEEIQSDWSMKLEEFLEVIGFERILTSKAVGKTIPDIGERRIRFTEIELCVCVCV